MFVAELVYPGDRLVSNDRAWAWKTDNIVRSLVCALDDAAIALLGFESEVGSVRAFPQSTRDEWVSAQSEQEGMELEVAVHLGLDRYNVEVRYQAEVDLKRRHWANGERPRSYERRVMFMHARSFLFSLDRIEMILGVLCADNQAPPGVATACAQLDVVAPTLRPLRNSVAHHEDRIRGLGPGQRPIHLLPIVDNAMIHAPSGGVLAVENLNNSRFGSTVADGTYAEIDVSESTLRSIRDCIQSVIQSYDWTGTRQHHPS